MFTKANRWSPSDESTVKSIIGENPGNMSKAFSEAALKTNRTVSAVQYKWYHELQHQEKVISTTGTTEVLVNRKNVKREKTEISPIHTVSTEAVYDGLRVVTTKQYFIN